MAFIHQTQPTIQLLLATADFVSALDLIDTSLEVLEQELAGLQCFRYIYNCHIFNYYIFFISYKTTCYYKQNYSKQCWHYLTHLFGPYFFV